MIFCVCIFEMLITFIKIQHTESTLRIVVGWMAPVQR